MASQVLKPYSHMRDIKRDKTVERGVLPAARTHVACIGDGRRPHSCVCERTTTFQPGIESECAQRVLITLLARVVPQTQKEVWKGTSVDEQLLRGHNWQRVGRSHQTVYPGVSGHVRTFLRCPITLATKQGTVLSSLPLNGEGLPAPIANSPDDNLVA